MGDQRHAGPADIPLVARWGTEHPRAPLVVALHGSGTSEHSLIEISPWLPHGPVAYVAVRGPLQLGSGYGWYTDPGDGHPDRERTLTPEPPADHRHHRHVPARGGDADTQAVRQVPRSE